MVGGPVGPGGQVPVAALVLPARICAMSGNTRVGLALVMFSPGDGDFSVSSGVTCAATPNWRNSGPSFLTLFSSAVPVDAADVVLLPHVGERVVLGVGRAAGERERRAQRDRVRGRRRHLGARVAGRGDEDAAVLDRAALAQFAHEAARTGAGHGQRLEVEPRERPAELDLEPVGDRWSPSHWRPSRPRRWVVAPPSAPARGSGVGAGGAFLPARWPSRRGVGVVVRRGRRPQAGTPSRAARSAARSSLLIANIACATRAAPSGSPE